MQNFKKTVFTALRFCRRKPTIFAIFRIKCIFFSMSYISSGKDPCVVKKAAHILRSLFYQTLVKNASSDKDNMEVMFVLQFYNLL